MSVIEATSNVPLWLLLLFLSCPPSVKGVTWKCVAGIFLWAANQLLNKDTEAYINYECSALA